MLYIIRHAPTQSTLRGLIQTIYTDDFAIIEKCDRDSFFAVMSSIVNQNNYYVISSPMARCITTAKKLDFNIDMITNVVTELDIGMYDGLKKEVFLKNHIQYVQLNIDEIQKNIENFIDIMYGLGIDKDYIVFSHGLFIKAFTLYVIGVLESLNFKKMFSNIVIKPLSISKFILKENKEISYMGVVNNE